VILAAAVILVVGLWLLLRVPRPFDGQTLALDDRELYSARYGLVGRPDRLFRDGEYVIPEEWKSSTRVYDSHRAQLGVYLILVEVECGVRPPYGLIRTGDGETVRVENTDEIRAWVLGVAERIREAKREIARPIPVRQPAAKCRVCGMRGHCGQRAG
jgi:CRISPR-associated exonuclease Cas4